MTSKKPSAPANVTLSAAKSLYRPGCEQNDRLAFLMETSPYRVRSFGLRPQDDIQEALSPLRVTLSAAKSLYRPGCEQNDRPAFLMETSPYRVRSFGLRPQDDIQEAFGPRQRHSERSEESLPARPRT